MCGIAGIYNYGSQRPVDRDFLTRITDPLSHRGPDDSGYFLDNEVGIGHRRLSIIDLSTGHQPILNEDKSLAVVCNGEIYNFPKLRQELEGKGHRFSTKSDTEVIVHLYEERGEDFVQDLRGMYSIALWDNKSRKLILVRDRLGIKPLFYAVDDDKILFASEIKSITAYPGFSKRIELSALHDYLSFMTTTGQPSIFQGVERLLPAEMLIAGQGKIEKRLYWDPYSKKARQSYSGMNFEDLFKDCVQSHLISDVPLGAFLSGGLDSSAVVAFMKEATQQPVKTFSIGFSGNKYFDESHYARQVAGHLGTDHHEFIINPKVQDVIPQMLDHFDEPFAVSSAVPTFFLAKLAREHVKVVLTGDGADEILAGYDYRYFGIKNAGYFDILPFLKHHWIEEGLSRVWQGKRKKLAKFFAGLRCSPRERYFHYMTKFQEEEKFDLYTDYILSEMKPYDSIKNYLHYYDECPGNDILNKWMYVDMKTSLPDEMLTKVDRMTMAFGLEARVPFLDHHLVEYLLHKPSSQKLHGRTSKYLLRKAVQNRLPPEILKREKHGFEVPVDDWIRGELKEYARHYFQPSRIAKQGIFNPESVNRIFKNHLEQKGNWGHQIWILLMFQVWYDKHFRN